MTGSPSVALLRLLMSNPEFTINTDEVDVAALVKQIRESVAEKKKTGAYSDAQVAVAERSNLTNLKDDEEFISLYGFSCLNADKLDKLSVVITSLKKSPEARANAAYACLSSAPRTHSSRYHAWLR